jgi:aspartyl-tRNA synthetase
MAMTTADYMKAEEPKWHVFTDEEIALGDLPTEEKKEEKKDTREAKKAERLAARQQKVAKTEEEVKIDPNDVSAALFGEREINRSQGDPELRFTKKFTDVGTLDESKKGEEVVVRGRIHNVRGKGGLAFFVLRE